MNPHLTRSRFIPAEKGAGPPAPPRLRGLLLALALALVLSLSVACGQTDLPTTPPPNLTTTPAATPTGIPPAPTLTANAAATLTVGEILAELRTSFATAAASNARAALTIAAVEQTALARPTPTLYLFPTPWPTSPPQPTPVVGPRAPEDCVYGVHDGFSQTDGSNCWIVRLDNEYLYVFGGYLYNVRSGDLSDTSTGAIAVAGGFNGWSPTPQQLGPIRIVAVDGARVTLQTYATQSPPVTFVFDLRARQWLDPAASPTPAPLSTTTLTRAQWDATKIAILEGTEYERQTRVASGTPFASTPIPLTQVAPVTTPVMGISHECLDHSKTFDFGNCWTGRISDEYVFIIAGAPKTDPTRGTLRVYTTSLDMGNFGPLQLYTTPINAGLIKVIDAVGERLTLRSSNDTLFYFDVLTCQWVNPAPTPVPSLPPTP